MSRALLLLLAAAVLQPILLPRGCRGSGCTSSESASAPPDGSAGGADASTGTSSASSSSSSSGATGTGAAGAGGSGLCEPQAIPAVVPAGWVEYTDWSCNCRFYIPGSKDVMPAPIVWQDCPVKPQGIACKAMLVDWTDGPGSIAVDPVFSVHEGKRLLAFRRVAKDYLLDLVAEVDGPVRTAIMRVKAPGQKDPSCFLGGHDLREGMYVISAWGEYASREGDSPRSGAIGGPVGMLHLPVIADYNDDRKYSWRVSSKWVMRIDAKYAEIRVFDWAKTQDLHVIAPPEDPMNMDINAFFASGEAVFWSTHVLGYNGLNVWTEAGGAKPFIRWLDDWTRGADDLGTDGIDMVWAYGEGKKPNDWEYPVQSVMTAPFTTDPDALQPRRLRSADGQIALRPFHVGCGYAVRGGLFNPNTFVVRLSDGVAWIVPDAWPELKLQLPIGVDCEEVFVAGEVNGQMDLIRVRLDSLGPGMPPD
ncbi:MAG: hypothetical protein HY744_33745 [Deltaproteobacteria bacterium]|nr:hypothetical protein [Deltaproteobacteria bacterium]